MEEERVLLSKLPELPDLHCAWSMLLWSCAARSNYLLRCVPPDDIAEYAEQRDAAIRDTLSQLLCLGSPMQRESKEWEVASLPLRMGGLGSLRSG